MKPDEYHAGGLRRAQLRGSMLAYIGPPQDGKERASKGEPRGTLQLNNAILTRAYVVQMETTRAGWLHDACHIRGRWLC
jgi:hypothetical protein